MGGSASGMFYPQLTTSKPRAERKADDVANDAPRAHYGRAGLGCCFFDPLPPAEQPAEPEEKEMTAAGEGNLEQPLLPEDESTKSQGCCGCFGFGKWF